LKLTVKSTLWPGVKGPTLLQVSVLLDTAGERGDADTKPNLLDGNVSVTDTVFWVVLPVLKTRRKN